MTKEQYDFLNEQVKAQKGCDGQGMVAFELVMEE